MLPNSRKSLLVKISHCLYALFALFLGFHIYKRVHDRNLNVYKIAENEVAIRDVAAAAIPLHRLIRLDMRPFHMAYWQASLASLDTNDTLISIYPDLDDRSTGYLYCPLKGEYTLTVRVPVPAENDGLHDIEPSPCILWREGGPHVDKGWWQRLLDLNSVTLRGMMEMCHVDPTQSDPDTGQIVTSFGGQLPPTILNWQDSIVFETRISCRGDRSEPDQAALDTLANRVYGAAAVAQGGVGKLSLGYWQRSQNDDKTAGSLFYYPERAKCIFTYLDHMFNVEQKHCALHQDWPMYHWMPFAQSRRDWLLTAEEVKTCFTRGLPIRLIGDSIMLQLWRGVDCLTRGYASLQADGYLPAESVASFFDMHGIFAPREVRFNLDEDEIGKLLHFESLNTSTGFEVWLSGAKYMSTVPSTDWVRGMRRWMASLQERSKQHNIASYLVLLTTTMQDPTTFYFRANWQTPPRIYAWNKLILQLAPSYNITVLDLFWPSTTRLDARSDHFHFCDDLNVETAMLPLRQICATHL